MVETGGEQAGLEAVGAQHGVLGESHLLEANSSWELTGW